MPTGSVLSKCRQPRMRLRKRKKISIRWNKAHTAAGFDPAEHAVPKDKWDRDSAEQWVRDRLARKETVLARDAPSKLFQFVREQLKLGWMDFLESLGVHDHGSHSIRRWSKETVMSEIRRCHSEAQPLNSAAIVQVDQSLLSTPASFSAREAAGV